MEHLEILNCSREYVPKLHALNPPLKRQKLMLQKSTYFQYIITERINNRQKLFPDYQPR